ncbi:MAG: glutamine--tRNA ligase, partial [Caldilinea sp.]
ERSDFSLAPPEDWTRLVPGGEVRLRHAYMIRCDEVVNDPASGEVVELRCSYDPDSLGKSATASRKRSTAIQWVAAAQAVPVEVRLYDRLFTVPNPDEVEEGKSFKEYLNPGSVEVIGRAYVEPVLAEAVVGSRYQFVRHGYFVVDSDSVGGLLVFNRIVDLPDAFASRLAGKGRETRQPVVVQPSEGGVGSISDERERVRAANPWLASRYAALTETLGLTPEQADPLTGSEEVVRFLDEVLAAGASVRAAANWINNDVLRDRKGRSMAELPFSGADLGELLCWVDDGTLTTAAARRVYAEMVAGQGRPRAIVARLGLDGSVGEEELAAMVAQVLAALPDKVAEYRSGRQNLLGMFTGQVMRLAGAKADPRQVQKLLRQQLAEEPTGYGAPHAHPTEMSDR